MRISNVSLVKRFGYGINRGFTCDFVHFADVLVNISYIKFEMLGFSDSLVNHHPYLK